MSEITEAFKALAVSDQTVVTVQEIAVRSAGTVVLRIEAATWPELGIEKSTELVVELSGVRGYKIADGVNSGRELRIEVDGPLCWDFRSSCSIMGNAPLPDPHRFFVEFSGLLSDLGARQPAIEYLNWRGSFAAWREIVVSRAFLLLNAPIEIAAPATELLDYQAAEYMLLNDQPPPGGEKVFAAAFCRSWITAEAAHRLK